MILTHRTDSTSTTEWPTIGLAWPALTCRISCRGEESPTRREEKCKAIMENEPSPSNLGAVVSVRGSVVDIRFDAHLPPIYSLLHAKEGKVAIEGLAQLDAHSVRGIALTPPEGRARGNRVEDAGGQLKAPVGKGILSRMFDLFGNAIDRLPAPADVQWRTVHRAPPPLARRSTKSEIFETGIKAIDVLV